MCSGEHIILHEIGTRRCQTLVRSAFNSVGAGVAGCGEAMSGGEVAVVWLVSPQVIAAPAGISWHCLVVVCALIPVGRSARIIKQRSWQITKLKYGLMLYQANIHVLLAFI